MCWVGSFVGRSFESHRQHRGRNRCDRLRYCRVVAFARGVSYSAHAVAWSQPRVISALQSLHSRTPIMWRSDRADSAVPSARHFGEYRYGVARPDYRQLGTWSCGWPHRTAFIQTDHQARLKSVVHRYPVHDHIGIKYFRFWSFGNYTRCYRLTPRLPTAGSPRSDRRRPGRSSRWPLRSVCRR